MTQYPDRFSIDGGETFVNATASLDPANATFGDWEWDNANNEIKFMGKFSKMESEEILHLVTGNGVIFILKSNLWVSSVS